MSPRFVPPSKPPPSRIVPAGAEWLHELKADGYRMQVAKDNTSVRIFSHGGHDWTKRLSGLAEQFARLPARAALLDGELVATDARGAPSFDALRKALSAGDQAALCFFAFDLLHRNGKDLTGLSLTERRRQLARVAEGDRVPCLFMVHAFDDGPALLREAERLGLEGIVCKRRAAPYRSGTCRDWVKVKTEAWRTANQERWRLFVPAADAKPKPRRNLR